MNAFRPLCACSAAAAAMLVAAPANAEVKIKLEEVAGGLTHPLAMVSIPDGSGRKAVIEQHGLVRIIDARGRLLPEPFLNIQAKIASASSLLRRAGLLGIAFHPNYRENGKFYIAYSAPLRGDAILDQKLWWSHTNTVSEMTVSKDNPNKANAELGEDHLADRLAAVQPQRPLDRLRPRRQALRLDRRRRLRQRLGHRPQRHDRQRPGSDVAPRQDAAPRRRQGRSRSDRQPLRRAQRRPAADLGATACATRGAAPSTWAATGSSSAATSSRTPSRRSSIITKGGNYGWRKMEGDKCFDYVNPNAHPASCDKTGLTDPILVYNNCTAIPARMLGNLGHRRLCLPRLPCALGRQVHLRRLVEVVRRAWTARSSSATKGADGKWTLEKAAVPGMSTLPYMLAFAQDDEGDVYALTSISTGSGRRTRQDLPHRAGRLSASAIRPGARRLPAGSPAAATKAFVRPDLEATMSSSSALAIVAVRRHGWSCRPSSSLARRRHRLRRPRRPIRPSRGIRRRPCRPTSSRTPR